MRGALVRSLLSAGLVAGMLAAPAAATAAGPPPAASASPTEPSRSVTLITGDRVTVTDQDTVAVHRGPGRSDVTFLTRSIDGQHYVLPSDAARLVADGRLDRRLFDVTLLRSLGYHDQRPDLPVLVSTEAGTPAPAAALAAGTGIRVVRSLPAIDGAALRVDKSATAGFWPRLRSSGATVWLDGQRELLLDQSVPQVGAPAAWAAGLDGAGVTVAVLDSGVDQTHPDLADRVLVEANFTTQDVDVTGDHGTHVAATVAGSGAASGGARRGVAPGARLLDGKVCVMVSGRGLCPDSAILAGMQWAAEQGADVVNLSLGGPADPDGDPLAAAVDRLTGEFGVLFVAAAGNAGADGSVGSPAVADAALAVGAVDRADALASFSSRGPRFDGALKPDLAAPGAGIVSAVPGGGYAAISGTSMAAPHVSGAAAILAQQHPEWAPDRLKAVLMGAAAANPATRVTGQGAGRLDVARAITQTVTADPPSISFDRLPFPHEDPQPQTRTVSYRNHGAEPVTLALSLAAIGPSGAPAPAGMFSVSAPVVTVPAGGAAEVSLTADPAAADGDGYYGGQLTATGPDLRVTTPFGIDREVESYHVTLRHTDIAGDPTGDYETILVRRDDFTQTFVAQEPEVTLRLPAGEYFLASQLRAATADGRTAVTMLVDPRLAITGDRTVELSASAGAPVSVELPDRDRRSEPVFAAVQAGYFAPGGVVLLGVDAPDPTLLRTGQLGDGSPEPDLTTTVAGAWAQPAAGGGGLGASPVVHHLAWFVEDRFGTGFERRVRAGELARIDGSYGRQSPDGRGEKVMIAIRPGPGGGPGVAGPLEFLPIDLPSTRTEYVNTDGGGVWLPLLQELAPGVPYVAQYQAELIDYRPGRPYLERWNYPVFGPAIALGSSGVFRNGDQLNVIPHLYGDGDGHIGSSPVTASTALFRNGVEVARSGSQFLFTNVGPEPADYRVEVVSDRSGPAPLSTHTELAWTFRSQRDGAGRPTVKLPVWTVRFDPRLGEDHTAAAGRPLLLPVRAQPAPESEPGALASLTVDVSFDDGAHWQRVPVLAGRLALVWHPGGEGFVSLRATAADTDGNTVEQTVIRAYRFG